MSQQDAYGSLAGGGTYRATPYMVQLSNPTGDVTATIDVNDLQSVSRQGNVVTLTRHDGTTIRIEAASLEDAGQLEWTVREGLSTDAAMEDQDRRPWLWGLVAVLGLAVLILGILALVDDDDGDDGSDDDQVGAVLTPTPDSDEAGGDEEAPTATPLPEEPKATPGEAPGEEPEPEPTDTPGATEPPSDATATAVGVEPTATTEPQATTTPADDGSGRDSPVPFGNVGQTRGWQVQVLDVVRGDDALEQLEEADPEIEPPPEGYEYVLANMRVLYTGSVPLPIPVNAEWFRSTGEFRIKHPRPDDVDAPDPALDATISSGDEASGWVVLLAREDEPNLLGIFGPPLPIPGLDELFLALEDGARIERIPERLAEPNDLGLDRAAPVAFGESIVGDTWEIRVVEIRRGEGVYELVAGADPDNLPPESGMEFVLVRVGARNVKPDSGAGVINGDSFTLLSDSGTEYTRADVVDPHPAFDFEVYPGGEVEGWITFEVANGDLNLTLVYKPPLSLTADPRYLALE